MDRQASRRTSGTGSPSTPGAVGVDPAEFAEYLRAERERRRLTLDQIADETKISSRHLEALERGDVRNWPGGMYRRAMMRAYAESIGVDREYALQQFERAFDAPPAHVEPPPAVPARSYLPRWRPSRRQLVGAGASLLSIAALFIAWDFAASLVRRDAEVPGTAALSAAPAAQPDASASAPVTTAPGAALPAGDVQPAVQETVATSGSPEPRLPATEGNLVVISEPKGARVTVNGIGWGDTPVTIRHLEFGPKRIRLTMQDYVSQERVVSLGPERPQSTVRFTLQPR